MFGLIMGSMTGLIVLVTLLVDGKYVHLNDGMTMFSKIIVSLVVGVGMGILAHYLSEHDWS